MCRCQLRKNFLEIWSRGLCLLGEKQIRALGCIPSTRLLYSPMLTAPASLFPQGSPGPPGVAGPRGEKVRQGQGRGVALGSGQTGM